MNRVDCPNCGHALKFKPEMAGKRARCAQCKNVFPLPAATAAGNDEKIMGAPADLFMEVLQNMANKAVENRRRNRVVRVLRVLQGLAVTLLLLGIVGFFTAEKGEEKLIGLGVTAIAFVGLLSVEGIARGMGLLK